MDRDRKTEISKFLSYVLRHNPSAIKIELDEAGWTSAEQLVVRVRKRYPEFNEVVLHEIVQTDAKQRYAMSHGEIRAQQGHSIDVVAVGTVKAPPEILYHGTTHEKWTGIQADTAIRPMSRQHVHLSIDKQTAVQVASRRRNKQRVVLTIRAGAMHKSGHEFRLSDNKVWLTERVPIEFIDIASDSEAE